MPEKSKKCEIFKENLETPYFYGIDNFDYETIISTNRSQEMQENKTIFGRENKTHGLGTSVSPVGFCVL